MSDIMSRIHEAVAYIRSKTEKQPTIGIILGSGLGGLAKTIEDPCCIPYAEIPHFKVSTAPSHVGQFVIGTLSGKTVICMQGGLHHYEGHAVEDVTFPVRVMRTLGIETLVLTNASGGINLDFNVGDLVLLKDHINFMGDNPLIGPNVDEMGPRFCDMTYVYPKALRDLAKECADELNIELREGVYLGCTGPSYETPAEIRAFRILGADMVGMSTVPEAIVASHSGMPVLAISLITNMAAGVLDQPLTLEEVVEVGQLKTQVMQTLVTAIVGKM